MTNPSERPSSVPVPRPSEPVTVLPDGSAFFVGTLSLPSDHWLYAPEYQPPPMGLRMSVSNPQRIEMVRHVTDAVRWAVRGATMKGTVADFDPDALVQNAVVGLLGYFAKDALSNDAWANPSPVPDETFVVRSPSVPTATQEQRDTGAADATYWRDKAKHMAALMAMAGATLCEPVSTANIRDAKKSCDIGVHVMREIIEDEKRAAARVQGENSQ